jgi:hypothetical protein
MEGGVMAVAELRTKIGMVEADDNVGGFEQHDRVLSEISDGHGIDGRWL